MQISDFLAPRLVGERFDGHSIPFDLLRDLAVLEAMVIEVAKSQYLRAHPKRQRTPRNFTEGVSLALTSVDSGSVTPKIALLILGGLVASQEQYFEQARDAIVGAIAAASEGRSPQNYLPQRSLAYFDGLGRSLLDGEAMEFSTGSGVPARLTKSTRLLLLQAAQVSDRTEEIHVLGSVHAVNQKDMTFEIMLSDGRKIPGPLGGPHIDAIMDASYKYRQGYKVQLDGVGRYNRSDKLQVIESIEHASLLDPLDFQGQLDDLKALKDGWLDGVGFALSHDGLDWLATTFNESYPDCLKLPYIYPVAEGGVRLEWSIGHAEASLEIDLDGRSGEWHTLDLGTDAEDNASLLLGTKNGWESLVSRILGLSGGES